MPVWRDDWAGADPQVVVVAPRPARNGLIREAIVILNRAQSEPVVTLTDAAGTPVRIEIPAQLLDGQRRNVDASTTLRLL